MKFKIGDKVRSIGIFRKGEIGEIVDIEYAGYYQYTVRLDPNSLGYEFREEELELILPVFKVGDKVRVIGTFAKGATAEVVGQRDGDNHYDIELHRDNRIYRFGRHELEPIPALVPPTQNTYSDYKVYIYSKGQQKTIDLGEFPSTMTSVEIGTALYDKVGRAIGDIEAGKLGLNSVDHGDPKDAIGDIENLHKAAQQPTPSAGQAKGGKTEAARHNKNKPHSDYIFTYVGGVDAVFDTEFDYYETMRDLFALYQEDQDPHTSARVLLESLRSDADMAGDDIVALLAETQQKGAAKYDVGNYLLPGPWRQDFQCAVRHAQKIQECHLHDEEGFPHKGNFYFNILRLCHRILTNTGTDDRIRAPK